MPAQITLPFLESMADSARDNIPLEFVGDTHSSTLVDSLPDVAGLAIGAVVSGAGIVASPPTTVEAINNAANTITLSQAATATAAGVTLTFVNPGTVFDTPQCVLFVNNPTLSLTMILSNLTQPTYPGYVIQDVSWNAIFQDPVSKDIVFESNLLTWQPTAAVTPPQAIYGYGLTSLVGGVQTLQRAQNLPTPKQFATPLDQTAFVLTVRMSATLVWGDVTQVS